MKRFSSPDGGDLDIDVFDAGATTAGEVVMACMTLPFLGETRLVVVDGLERFDKESLETLVDYCEAPSETAVLCLVAEKLAANTRLRKAISKHFPKAIIDCSPKGKGDLPALVSGMARAHGVTIDAAAARALIELVGSSTVRLDSEMAKMAAAVKPGGRIGTDTVTDMVTATAELKPWDLQDALGGRDARRVEYVLARMGSQSTFGLLALVTNRLRDLIRVLALEGRAADVAGSLGRPDWQARNLRTQAHLWSDAELRGALRAVAEAEKDMKSGADQQLRFERLLLSLCR